MVLADCSTVAGFAGGGAREHPPEWAAFKQDDESRLMDPSDVALGSIIAVLLHTHNVFGLAPDSNHVAEWILKLSHSLASLNLYRSAIDRCPETSRLFNKKIEGFD